MDIAFQSGQRDEPVFPIWIRICSPEEFIQNRSGFKTTSSQISASMPAGQHSGFTILLSGF
jgi:hypothetical protein